MLPIDDDHILTLEKDGFIEIINTKQLEIVFTTQHSSKQSINQAIQTQTDEYLEFALAISEYIHMKKNYTGMLAFIRVDQNENGSFLVTEVHQYSKDNVHVFSVQQILKEGRFILMSNTVSSEKPYCFRIYDRSTDSIIDTFNTPTESVNLNCLIKSPFFA